MKIDLILNVIQVARSVKPLIVALFENDAGYLRHNLLCTRLPVETLFIDPLILVSYWVTR